MKRRTNRELGANSRIPPTALADEITIFDSVATQDHSVEISTVVSHRGSTAARAAGILAIVAATAALIVPGQSLDATEEGPSTFSDRPVLTAQPVSTLLNSDLLDREIAALLDAAERATSLDASVFGDGADFASAMAYAMTNVEPLDLFDPTATCGPSCTYED